MDADNDSSDSGVSAGDAPIASVAVSGNVNASAQQLEASVSRFAQQSQGGQQSLIALINQISDQLRTINAKVGNHSAELERHVGWIVNLQP